LNKDIEQGLAERSERTVNKHDATSPPGCLHPRYPKNRQKRLGSPPLALWGWQISHRSFRQPV